MELTVINNIIIFLYVFKYKNEQRKVNPCADNLKLSIRTLVSLKNIKLFLYTAKFKHQKNIFR